MSDKKKKSNQQKPKSKTARTINQPKREPPPTEPPNPSINLCDNCAYEYGECDGEPKFASDFVEGLTGAEADHVIKCSGFVDAGPEPAKEGPGTDHDGGDPEQPSPWDIVPQYLEEEGKAIWNARRDEIVAEVERRYEGTEPSSANQVATAVLIIQDMIPKEGGDDEGNLGLSDEVKERLARPDPKRFQADEDFGTCPSCGEPLKRTAYSRYVDAVRCTNLHCHLYREIVKTVPTGAK